MYRGGVGDGQLKTLIEYEVPQLLSSVTEASSSTRYEATVLSLHSQLQHISCDTWHYYMPVYLFLTQLRFTLSALGELRGMTGGIQFP